MALRMKLAISAAHTSLFSEVGEARRALLRLFGFHFLGEGPFTLRATMVWSSKASTPSAWFDTASKDRVD